MKLLSVVHDEWSAALTDRLVVSGLVGAVAPTDSGAKRLWDKCPAAARLGQIERPAPGAEPLAGVEEVLVYGRPVLPDWIDSALGPVLWFQVTAATESCLVVSDPVHWCLRHGQPGFRLRVHRSGAGLPDTPTLAEVRVELPNQDYAAGVSAAAGQLTALLSVARESREPPPGHFESLVPLPLDRLALRIDWTASAIAVARLVRSGAGRLTPAWTYLNGYPVSIEAAQPVRMTPSTVAPGTVIRCESSVVVVQTGSGAVRVSHIRDALGALPMTVFRPGLRFGIDHDEEWRTLRRRVADLECLVNWLLSGQRADRGQTQVAVTLDGNQPPSR